MSETTGSSGSGSAGRATGTGTPTAGAATRAGEGGVDERSQRLLQGGAASRSWADTAARETVRTDVASASTTTNVTPGSVGAATTAATAAAARGGQPRRARLRISHLTPLSVLRLALLFGACMLVVLLVAVAALWFVLDSAGVFRSITEATSTITDGNSGGTASWFSFGRVMLITAVIGVINLVTFTLLSTVATLLYNLCSDFVGGVEVTLSER